MAELYKEKQNSSHFYCWGIRINLSPFSENVSLWCYATNKTFPQQNNSPDEFQSEQTKRRLSEIYKDLYFFEQKHSFIRKLVELFNKWKISQIMFVN
jgi:hypothetical protein